MHGTADPIHADIGDYIDPVAAVFSVGECGAAKSVVSVSEIETKAKSHAYRPAALVLYREIMGGLARSPVLCSARDSDDLAEKVIPRLLARAQSVD